METESHGGARANAQRVAYAQCLKQRAGGFCPFGGCEPHMHHPHQGVRANPLVAAYSGDRDRLRSVQELRCANCIVGVAHCSKRCPVLAVLEVQKGVQEVRGWGSRAKPAGAGQATAPGKRSASGRRQMPQERWVTDGPAGTAGCPHPCGVGRSVIHGGRESHALHEPHPFVCLTQADFSLASPVADVADFALPRSDSPIRLKR